jgi:alanyl-tRNA synthetase
VESAEIRRRFLDFFGAREHTVVPSASVLLADPTLLFVNAGMVPFKPYFLGQETPPFRRATSVQKVVRTNDIDEVGKTTRHASFFQMAGNFSFGDYFKAGAIPLAWELLTASTADGGFGFPESRLWVTVYVDDDEAYDVWRRDVGVPAERIQRRGLADNYWHMGVPGPGGPCSEIYYDRGPEHGPDGGPIVDEERFLEVWNLVFMQYELSAVRTKTDFDIAGDLPAKNIDTGLGLERMATLLQGVDNLYDIDTSRAVLDRAAELSGARYHADHTADVRLRVVTDHTRTTVFLIGDGVTPGNEGRGYVLRRMLRRVVRSMRLLGAGDVPTIEPLVRASITAMAPQYPELAADAERIVATAVAEEAAFLQTLRQGTQIFDLAATQAKAEGARVLAGDTAFRLHDTFGFPIDLTLEMAEEAGLQVDQDAFTRLMTEQRERAKADAKAKKTGHADLSIYRDLGDRLGGPVEFIGYDDVAGDATVRGLVVDGGAVPAVGAGQQLEVVLDRTPFYAESGGQLADAGVIEVDGALIEVHDVQRPTGGLIVHRGRVLEGEVVLDAPARALVDVARRAAISRSHTATHMVHQGFRDALGAATAQAGSENSPGRFRFDFTATGAVPASVLRDVEDRVNTLVADDLEVWAELMTLDEARRSGAVALFGEKYGDEVRVVNVGEYSRELCGGTHVHSSGVLGLVTILGESSIGQGVRRVEALVGLDAFRYLAREHVLVAQLTEALAVRPDELPERVASLVSRVRAAEKELERVRSAAVLGAAASVAAQATDVDGAAVVTHRPPDGTTADDLRRLAHDVRSRLGEGRPAVVAVASVVSGRPLVVVATNAGARERGVRAGALVKELASRLGGGGGGKDDIAQGGGTSADGLDAALAAVPSLVARTVAPS